MEGASGPAYGGLTRAEAGARAELLDVDRYEVHLDLTGLAAGTSFRSRSSVWFACSSPGASTWIDLAASQVHEVNLNGTQLSTAEVVHGDRVQLEGLQSHNELVVEATHGDTGSGVGLTRSVDAADGSIYAWTNFEPFDAHRAYACFDQPDLKARFRFSAAVPGAWTCVSNGSIESIGDLGDVRLWKFSETPSLPPYVTALCAGPFHSRTATHGGIALGLHARRSLAGFLDADAEELFDLTRRGLDFFGERFSMPYPSDTYDHVFLPDLGGAMENFGCVTWSDRGIFRSPPTRLQAQGRAVVLLHEMAHMWFGDMVTMRWWDGLWLNESFADWAAFWAAAAATPYVNAWCQFSAFQKRRAYDSDQSPTTHPIHRDVPDIAAAEASFDSITYTKGASVLRQLVAWVGEDSFLEGLRAYFKRFQWGNSDLEGLLDELSAASGRDLGAWSREWLRTSGVDTLRLEVSELAGRYERAAVRQHAPPEHPFLRSHRVAIGAYEAAEGGPLRRTDRLELDVSGESTEIEQLREAGGADLLLLNDDDLAYAKVRLDDRSRTGLLETGHTLPAPLSRAVGLQIVWDMLVDGELAASAVVDFVIRGIATETEESNLSALISTGVEALEHYAPRRQLERLQAAMAAALLDAAARSEPGSPGWITLQSGVTATARSQDQVRALRSLLSGDSNHDQSVRWRALTRLAALDEIDDDSIDAEEKCDPDPDAAFRAIGARAARGRRQDKDRAFRSLFADPPSSPRSIVAIGTSFWQPHQEELLRSYAREFMDRLPGIARSRRWLPARRLLQVAFPDVGLDEGLLDRAEALGNDPSTLPVLAVLLRERAWELRRELRARGG